MGNYLSNDDTIFQWEYTDQPHADRRIRILRKHPEIRRLMKCRGDRWMAVIGVLVAIGQLCLGLLISQIPLTIHMIVAMLVGSFVSSWLLISLHEASHCLLFGPSHPRLNRLYGLLVNIPLVIPVFTYFKRHHRRHHKHMANQDMDAEYPTVPEAHIFSRHTLLKYIWLMYHPLIQRLRSPFLGDGTRDWLSMEEFLNMAMCSGFSVWLFWSGREYVWTYLALSTFVGMGTNFFGIWGTTVHWMYFHKEPTISYYGWMNPWAFNFGYHMEHHDFPNVPARLLPQIRQIAPEFYEDHHHLDDIYSAVLQWLHDPRLGLFSRLKRDDGGNALLASASSL